MKTAEREINRVNYAFNLINASSPKSDAAMTDD